MQLARGSSARAAVKRAASELAKVGSQVLNRKLEHDRHRSWVGMVLDGKLAHGRSEHLMDGAARLRKADCMHDMI